MNQVEMLTVDTSRFGPIQVAADTVLKFPKGLVGLEQLTRFALIEGSGPFQWLQSLDDPEITFVVLDSEEVISDYEINPADEDLAVVSAADEDASLVALLVVTIPRDGEEPISANLMAPLLVNVASRTAVQAVLPDRYPVRHPVVAREDAPHQMAKAG